MASPPSYRVYNQYTTKKKIEFKKKERRTNYAEPTWSSKPSRGNRRPEGQDEVERYPVLTKVKQKKRRRTDQRQKHDIRAWLCPQNRKKAHPRTDNPSIVLRNAISTCPYLENDEPNDNNNDKKKERGRMASASEWGTTSLGIGSGEVIIPQAPPPWPPQVCMDSKTLTASDIKPR